MSVKYQRSSGRQKAAWHSEQKGKGGYGFGGGGKVMEQIIGWTVIVVVVAIGMGIYNLYVFLTSWVASLFWWWPF